jgi:sodium-dependent dicarboxylate transporter 2/3/5
MTYTQQPLQADDEGVTMPMTSKVVMSEEEEEVEGSESSDTKYLADTKHSSDPEDPPVASSVGPIRLGVCSVGLIIGFIICFIEIDGNRKINQTLAIAIWMASFWLTETIPLVVTAFLPLFLFPLFGIVSSGAIAAKYMNNTIVLFISGFLMALTLERWNIHRRFSLKILSWCGAEPGSLLAGMMASTFFLSMFVSNTATALMMLPNAVSVCESLERSTLPQFRHESRRFGIALMLGIAYSANVGGMASLIGTPPNLVFQAQLAILFPDSPEITFATWLGFGLPLGLVTAVIIWVYLRFMYLRNFKGESVDRSTFTDEYLALGAWSREQIGVSLLFTLLAFLWIFRSDIEFSSFTIQGWANIFPEPSFISDATIGMLIAVVMFVTPARPSKLPDAADDAEDKPTTTLLTWETANKMPYDIVFLFGGGFALAKGFVDSGLSAWLGELLGNLSISLAGQVFLFIFVIAWLTELTSNTATSNIMIPIGASIAYGSQVSPYTFMIPAAMACSCAFCLPIATPPNMVVFSSGRLPLIEMNKAGVLLNIISTLLIFGTTFSIIPAVLDVGADEFPAWAENSPISTN